MQFNQEFEPFGFLSHTVSDKYFEPIHSRYDLHEILALFYIWHLFDEDLLPPLRESTVIIRVRIKMWLEHQGERTAI